ncbi:hypothetical protein EON83_26840 [bacterium]|nr:MAG: hypothetical protein EON83_26840 [bacterium]
MEFESLSEDIKREARRVAAAFGVENWAISIEHHGFGFEHQNETSNLCHYVRIREDGVWIFILISDSETYSNGCRVSWHMDQWLCTLANVPVHNEVMGRGLYRLGFDNEAILSQLSLTAHEKLELRLSTPREFWPNQWQDKEAANY